MKVLLSIVALMIIATNCYASINYIESYTRGDGTQVRGHYRDTSNDGDYYNNANTLGYNG